MNFTRRLFGCSISNSKTKKGNKSKKYHSLTVLFGEEQLLERIFKRSSSIKKCYFLLLYILILKRQLETRLFLGIYRKMFFAYFILNFT